MSKKDPAGLTEDELDSMLRQVGHRSGLLLPSTSSEVADSEEAFAAEDATAVPDWIRNPLAFEKALGRRATQLATAGVRGGGPTADFLARAARDGSGQLSDEVVERMKRDRQDAREEAEPKVATPDES